MKKPLLLPAALLLAAPAQAQLLPVPNARNPDWELLGQQPGRRPSRPDSLQAGRRDRMPIADLQRNAAPAPMPNALSGSISSAGNRHRYWDASRQLAYEWAARPGRPAPDSVVTVYQQATGVTFTFGRRTKTR